MLFDILARQKDNPSGSSSVPRHSRLSKSKGKMSGLDFDVEDFYCLGSPIGLFQMLKGRTISARNQPDALNPVESPLNPDAMDDPFLAGSKASSGFSAGENISSITGLPFTVSSPKCARLYNIFVSGSTSSA